MIRDQEGVRAGGDRGRQGHRWGVVRQAGLLGAVVLLLSFAGCPTQHQTVVPEVPRDDPDVRPQADEDDFIDQRGELGG